MTPPKAANDLPVRIAHLETAYESLRDDVRGLVESSESFQIEMRRSLGALGEQLAGGKATNWSTIASWVAVVITIGGLSLYPIMARLSAIETDSVLDHDKLTNEYRSHISDGHPRRVEERIADLRDRFMNVSADRFTGTDFRAFISDIYLPAVNEIQRRISVNEQREPDSTEIQRRLNLLEAK